MIFFLSAFASTFEKITYRLKRNKKYIKRKWNKRNRYKRKKKDKKYENEKNIIIFIALHKDNRFENDFFYKAFFHFFYKFCEKYISIFKSQLPIIAKS